MASCGHKCKRAVRTHLSRVWPVARATAAVAAALERAPDLVLGCVLVCGGDLRCCPAVEALVADKVCAARARGAVECGQALLATVERALCRRRRVASGCDRGPQCGHLLLLVGMHRLQLALVRGPARTNRVAPCNQPGQDAAFGILAPARGKTYLHEDAPT